MYTDDQKYNSISNNFDYKLTIFYNIYKRVDVLERAYFKALLLMLSGLALDYYYNTRLAAFIFKDTCKSLYSFFRGLSSEYKSLNKQNLILLQTVM